MLHKIQFILDLVVAQVKSVGPAMKWTIIRLWRWSRVLWVCRIPAVSALGGGFLLAWAPQARDLFADTALGMHHWIVFFVFVAVWAWIVHATARRSLRYDDWVPEAHVGAGLTRSRRLRLQRFFYWPALVIPRLLGAIVIFSVGWAICRTRLNLLPIQNTLPEAAIAIRTADRLLVISIVILLFLLGFFCWRRQRGALGSWIPAFSKHHPGTEAPLLTGERPIFAGRQHIRTRVATMRARAKSPAVSGLWLCRAFILIALVTTLINPHLIAEHLPRVFYAPVLFGGIVLLLAELAAWSHRLHTPFLLLLVGVSGALLYIIYGFHDVRWVAEPQRTDRKNIVGLERQIGMVAAVERWKIANKCSPVDKSECPRPIIIAGAGGASRAAFLTASTVGALVDLGLDPETAPVYGNVRNRIFALSTVSGSSVGAVMMRAALADAAEDGSADTPPCKTKGTGSWFGFKAPPPENPSRFHGVRKSWRDCFQVLLAGDFLSPVLVGLSYRDNFPLGDPRDGQRWWEDRAGLLEQAFERRYHYITDGAPQSCDETNERGLCRRFGYHPDPRTANVWLPLLFINGTSVTTGRRIIVSDVRAGDNFANERTLFPLAYDLNEIASWAPPAKSYVVGKVPRDIRLSTASTMSARFPLISPHGNLRDRTGDVADRIVDGGYFENDGLATAGDLVLALNYFKLDPMVIRIVNEPVHAAAEERKLGPRRPQVPDDKERTPFDGMTSIFRTLTATRSGHEEGHAAYLKSVLSSEARLVEMGVFELTPESAPVADSKRMMTIQQNPICRQKIGTKGRLGEVSMSWWVSQPVQEYLDAQLCVRGNWERLECELRNGWSHPFGDCPPKGTEVAATRAY
jgi:hypothetical protein